MENKDRLKIEKVKMPEADPEVRSHSSIEVNSGISKEQAVMEAHRCLNCKNPTCMEGCPVSVNIPKFIKEIEEEKFEDAITTIKQTNLLPAICGRVCPQEKQCEASCIYTLKMGKPSVAIGYLERFAADYEREQLKLKKAKPAKSNGIKVAVIGSGPAGLTFAGEMATKGCQVTVFEALHKLGGVLRYGIPEFRLPKEIVDYEINSLKDLGVEFRANFIVGKTISFEQLKDEGYKAFFVGSGAGLPNFMNIKGENSIGVMSSNEYLTRVNLMNAGKKEFDTPIYKGKFVAVIGGGNTAMDSVRTAKRLGAERAMIIYRRSFDEMPARLEEIKHAKEEGIEFMNLNNPVEYIADEKGRVKKMILQKMELSEPDESGRKRPVPIKGSEYEVDVDLVVVSVGVSPNPLVPNEVKELKTSKWGTIITDDNLQTNVEEIYAGGDIVRGGATVILAMGDGRKAANEMYKKLTEK